MTPPPDWFDTDEAQQLLRHLEWQPEGFSLLFVFADALPAQWLADWLNAELRPAGLPLQQPACAALLAHDPDALVEALMAELTTLQAAPGAVWLPMLAHPQQPDWDAARRKLLARLNERRFLLERDLPRPLLLVLPANFRPITREIAPDIWHIRVLSQQWRTPALSVAQNWCWEKLPAGFPISWDRLPWMGRAEDSDALKSEWNKNKNHSRNIEIRWRACSALAAAGRLAEAKELILEDLTETFDLIKSQDNLSAANTSLASMMAYGVLYYLFEQEAHKKIISIFHRLLAEPSQEGTLSKPSSEEFMFKMFQAYWLGYAFYMLKEPGNSMAIELYEVALLFSNKITESDLSLVRSIGTCQIKYGQARIAASSGKHAAARSTYQVSLAHYQKAIAINPASASALQRDLALIQVGLADAHMGLQDWPAAEQALAKSVAIFRQLAAVPRAPRHAREDLAIALARQALLPPGDLAPLQEAERILLQLCAEFVEVPAYPRELDAIRELAHLLASSVAHSG